MVHTHASVINKQTLTRDPLIHLFYFSLLFIYLSLLMFNVNVCGLACHVPVAYEFVVFLEENTSLKQYLEDSWQK